MYRVVGKLIKHVFQTRIINNNNDLIFARKRLNLRIPFQATIDHLITND